MTLTFDLESDVRVTHDANFGLPRPLCSRLRPMYVTDRQKHRIMPPPRGRGVISESYISEAEAVIP